MSNDKIRIGIIGANAQYGWGMRAHLPAILALPDYELTAVCTSRPDTAQESKKAYGAGMAFHDFREMVKHPDIDLVSVSVRVPWHYDMVMGALEAGKHVFCESPLGANLAETEEMATLARAKGVRHMVSLQARGAPAVLHLRDSLAQGYVGEVLACNMTMFYPGLLQRGRDMAWMADRKMGADTLAGVTCHVIDILCYCVGEFQELSAKVATQVPEWETRAAGKRVSVTASDNVLINGVLAGGAVVSAHIGNVPWHGTGWRMEVYGREGTVVASSQDWPQFGNIQLWGVRGNQKVVRPTGLEKLTVPELEKLTVPDRLIQVPGKMLEREPFDAAALIGQLYLILAKAIQGGSEVGPDFDLAVKRHRLLDVIQRSSDEGRKLKVL